jgi:hypothetical protein
MLVQVLKRKVVLGKGVYRSGDIFDCRATEARVLIQAGALKAAPLGSEESSPQWPPAKKPFVATVRVQKRPPPLSSLYRVRF